MIFGKDFILLVYSIGTFCMRNIATTSQFILIRALVQSEFLPTLIVMILQQTFH